MCEKKDLDEFRWQLFGYTLAVENLLGVIQASVPFVEIISARFCWQQDRASIEAQKERQNEQHKTISGLVQHSYLACMKYLSVLVGQGRVLFKTTSEIV